MKAKKLDQYPGFVDWLRANHKRMLVDLAEEAARLFTPDVTTSKIMSMKSKYGLQRRSKKTQPLTREEKDFIIFNYDKTPPGVMARKMEAAFNKEIPLNRVSEYYQFCGISPTEYGGIIRNPKRYE